jgi:hypothetical protein
LSLCDKKGEYFLVVFGISTGNVFSNRLSVFVREWPKGEFVSIILATFWIKQKHIMYWLRFNRMVGFKFRIFMYSENDQIQDNN